MKTLPIETDYTKPLVTDRHGNLIDLSPRQLAEVRSIFHRHLPNTQVWAYGSRAAVSSDTCEKTFQERVGIK